MGSVFSNAQVSGPCRGGLARRSAKILPEIRTLTIPCAPSCVKGEPCTRTWSVPANDASVSSARAELLA